MQHHPGELKLAFEEFIKEDNAFGRVCTRMDRPVNVELIEVLGTSGTTTFMVDLRAKELNTWGLVDLINGKFGAVPTSRYDKLHFPVDGWTHEFIIE